MKRTASYVVHMSSSSDNYRGLNVTPPAFCRVVFQCRSVHLILVEGNVSVSFQGDEISLF